MSLNILSVMQVFSDCLLLGTVPELLLSYHISNAFFDFEAFLRIKEVYCFGNLRDKSFFLKEDLISHICEM